MRTIVLSVAALLFHQFAQFASAQAGEKLPPPGEWRMLFDGKTLANWKSTAFGGEGEVLVEDGALVIDMGNPLTGVTWTGQPLPKVNYEVELEARRMAGSDFFCALTFPVAESHASLVLGGWGGTVIGISSINGYDASENETSDYYKFEKNQWYKIRLQVTQTHLRAWINDKQIADVEHPRREMSVRIEVEPSKPFGISTYQTQGAIRNLRLRTLPPVGDGKPAPESE
ncbi:MAG: DUF1080 domain-containing protein [Planctomycetaceae bacterium]